MRPAERRQTRLILFQVNAGCADNALRGKMVLRAEGRKGCFQLFRRRAALAADTQHRNAGDQVQRLTRRGQRQRKICAVSGGGRLHTRGRRAGNSPVGGIANALPGQQCPAHAADALRLGHGAVLAFGPLVHGKNASSVGGRRDDRHGMADRRQPLRQLVCAAQMPRQQRNRELPTLIQHNDGGVCSLAAAVWRDGPHRDPGSSYKNQCVALCKLRSGPIGQADTVRTAAGHAAGAGCRQLLRQRQSPRRERNVRAGHRSVPLRNSVVNAGSYSLLRSYCAAKKSPTTMSAVLVMPAARVLSASVPTVQCTIFCSGHVAL